MVTVTSSLVEISRFHEMVLSLRADRAQPVIAVQSEAGDWRADIRPSDGEVIDGEIDSLDLLSVREWLSLRQEELAETWRQCTRGASPDHVEPLPEDWPIGGPPPTRAVSVRPLEGYRLWVEWEDGSSGELVLDHLADHPAFTAWRDRDRFEAVRIVGSSLSWGDGMEVCAWLSCWPHLDESPRTTAVSGAR